MFGVYCHHKGKGLLEERKAFSVFLYGATPFCFIVRRNTVLMPNALKRGFYSIFNASGTVCVDYIFYMPIYTIHLLIIILELLNLH